jgi:dTDP-4-amino-4,6-dideoxygalactose transaminase
LTVFHHFFETFIFGGEFIVSWFVSNPSDEIFSYAMMYLKTVSWFFLPLAMIFLYRNALQGLGEGLVPVDFAGYPLDLEEFRKLADEYGLWIIEDACHAPGGYFMDSKGKKQHCGNGCFADCAVFSFHPVKHIATGEGGMVTTNSKELYDRLCLYRTHGITKDPALLHEHHGGWYYEMQEIGYNYRLTDFQAALGISQLERAKAGLERRHEIVRRLFSSRKNFSTLNPCEFQDKVVYLQTKHS